jgi:DNA-directed RNA polymerase specialized sigma24 family protein
MPIDDQIVARARRFNRPAVETIFTELFPAVHRMAYGLTGHAKAGSAVERFVLKRAMRVLETWKDELAPERWFFHHTVLATRRARYSPADVKDDLLVVTAAPAPDGARETELPYHAFIRALRGLPMQQREAFILRHGEQFNPRSSAVAMDLSVQATSQHLSSAEAALRPIAGDRFDALVAEMSRRYKALTPNATITVPKLRQFVARRIWPRRILRILGWLLLIGAFAGIAYAVWKLRPMIEY